MKNHFPFDQYFKQELQDAESFVPDHLFENIMAERKRRRGFVIFFQNNALKYGLTACAVLAAAGVVFLKKNPKPTETAISSPFQQPAMASIPADGLPNQVASVPKALILNTLSKKEPLVVKPKSRAVERDLVVITPPNPKRITDEAASLTSVSQTDIALITVEPELLNIEPTHVNAYHEVERVANESKIITQKSPIAKLSTDKVSSLEAQFRTDKIKSVYRKLGPDIGCPTFSVQNPNRWYIDIWGSPDYAFRKLYNNQGENTNYAKARDSVESSWYAFSAGARVSLVLESGVAIRAGLNYLQNNEVFDYKLPGQVRTVTITETVKQPNGTTLTQTHVEKQYGTYELKKYNRYRSVDVPIQLGYEFGGRPWSYSVNGGVNFNLTSWRKAEILNPALVPADASKNEANVFKSSVGASLYASFAAYYDWKDYTQLFIEPYIRHFLSPITTKDYALAQRYTDVGLKLGVRWRL
ncbi:MAG: hypothetical protein RLZZ628_782 [Bacteroidota bacterium]|jgi:hypothetical protein